MSSAQKALVVTIGEGMMAVGKVRDDLERKQELPPLGNDAVSTFTLAY